MKTNHLMVKIYLITFSSLLVCLFFACQKQEVNAANKKNSAEHGKTEVIDLEQKMVFRTQEELNQWAEVPDKKLGDGVKIVQFEEGIQKIPAKSFFNLPIYEVFLPSSVTEIEDYAFYGCEKLESVHWQKGLKHIGWYSFKKTGIRELLLPDGVTEVGYEAFAEMSNLVQVYLPDSIEKISSTFSNCPKLESIHLSNSIKILHAGTLENAIELNELIIPASVQIIDVDVGADSGVRRIVFQGSPQLICRLNIKKYPNLGQLVFCSAPPAQDTDMMKEIEDGGLGIYGSNQCSLFYLNSFATEWAPNGEPEWNGFPLIGIDSLDELPPLE